MKHKVFYRYVEDPLVRF